MLKNHYKYAALLASAAMVIGCHGTVKTALNHPQKITGLKTPESVVQARDGRIYISEINEFGKDGDGQITVLDRNGKTAVFATGLDDPKGLAIIGQYLYAADKNKIIRIGPDGKTSVFVASTAFPSPPIFLNDLEADPQGNLYVSDSGDVLGKGGGGAIYRIDAKGQVTLLINDKQDARIAGPNGLLADDTGNFLLEVDFASGILYSLNTQTGQLTDIAEGFGGGDGLVHHSNGTMYVSDWKNGKVFSVNTKGDVAVVRSGYQAAADIAITKDEAYLLVPDMKAGELDFIPLK
ncbi:SMP-30/gluconolactonase/LRE family protein [Methylotenera sp. G11]|uniref:SMP-30/gluconolactonase/LRE family protein n=1 Tax=Methylotenera sp. G11 TaxID=1506585 RepID=UPI00068D9D73|nr:SMP-30/gluconolactonase/LRE family protein [Methylotenera sp. G11]